MGYSSGMSIPASGTGAVPVTAGAWPALTAAEKRERLLSVAADVFARHGLDAPMSEVAEAAGAGVASVYRCFASKHELVAALVARRLDQIAAAAGAACARSGDRWTALTDMLTTLVSRQESDSVLGEARVTVANHPDVIAATVRTTAALEELITAARAEGRLRADATAVDLRLLFAATRAAKQLEPERWPRMLQLMIDALDTRAHHSLPPG